MKDWKPTASCLRGKDSPIWISPVLEHSSGRWAHLPKVIFLRLHWWEATHFILFSKMKAMNWLSLNWVLMKAPGALCSEAHLNNHHSKKKKEKKYSVSPKVCFKGKAGKVGVEETSHSEFTFCVPIFLCRLSNLTIHNEPKFCVWENWSLRAK